MNECDCDIIVYFRSEFQYPLGSDYVVYFGGEEDGLIDCCEITWTDSNHVLELLQTLGPLSLLDDFPRTLQGTQALYDFLKPHGHSAYLFGCILYHQLLYNPVLQATIETGQCGSQTCWHQSNPTKVPYRS